MGGRGDEVGGISALTSEKAATVAGEGVKDAVGCHDREAGTVWCPRCSRSLPTLRRGWGWGAKKKKEG